mmetsp:Transcript_48640/g.95355  ORF Transcript_48640/g.95355 Transcript_48640/m.95355 type:complete len:702 (+) Transcript_48640:52-2157(+)
MPRKTGRGKVEKPVATAKSAPNTRKSVRGKAQKAAEVPPHDRLKKKPAALAVAPILVEVRAKIAEFAKEPEKFFVASKDSSKLADKLSGMTKALFDFSKQEEDMSIGSITGGPLKELLVESFDVEQIWQQLEVQNETIVPALEESINAILNQNLEEDCVEENELREAEGREMAFDESEDKSDQEDEGDQEEDEEELSRAERRMMAFDDMEDEGGEGDGSDFDSFEALESGNRARGGLKPGQRKLGPLVLEEEEDEGDFDEEDYDQVEDYLETKNSKKQLKAVQEENEDEDEDEDGSKAQKRKKGKRHELDDDFFSFEEMERFADEEGTTMFDGRESDDEVDLLDGAPSDYGQSAMFSDFFDDMEALPEEKNRGDLNESESEAEEEIMSAFERRTANMNKQIQEHEERLLQPRSWDLSGEVDVKKRPADSLLETDLDFEYASKPTEDITEESTSNLEALIKQRIMDEAWDDPERKDPVEDKPFTPVDELSTEKSKLGLAEVYEQEFLNLAKDSDEPTAAQEKLSKEHQEIASLFAKLSYKLDALADFSFAPKPPKQDIVISSSTPAIQMEEVIPMGVSSAQLIAPQEEWKPSTKGQLLGETEVTSAEKKSKRAKKKRIRKRTLKEREKKMGDKGKVAKEISATMAMRHVSKGKDSKDNTKFSSSKEVFKMLADQPGKKGRTEHPARSKAATSSDVSSQKLKL